MPLEGSFKRVYKGLDKDYQKGLFDIGVVEIGAQFWGEILP